MIFDSPTIISQTIVSGSLEVTGSAKFANGLSGSLTRLPDGTSYLIAGSGITVVTGSNDSLTISTISTLTGSGPTNYVSKWSSLTTLTGSQIFDDGIGVGIGTTNIGYKFQVSGSSYFSGNTFTDGLVYGYNFGGLDALASDVRLGIFSGYALNIGFGTAGTNIARFSSAQVSITGSLLPGTDNTYDIGSTAKRWRTLFAANISGSLTGSNLLAGQVVVAGTSGLLSGSNLLFWNNSNNRLGVGTSSPGYKLDVPTGDASFYGVRVGRGNASTSGNVAVGGNSVLASVTSGIDLTAVGDGALAYSTTGADNTGIGFGALFVNTSGSNNTAVGSLALFSNDGNSNSTAIGYSALGNTTGARNTAIGAEAGTQISTGTDNVVIGRQAGNAITTGGSNTIIGSVSGTTTLSNTIILAAGTAERIRIDSSGNVGIGTTLMTDKLAINGSVSVTGSALPGIDNTYNLGSSSKRWNTIFAANVSGSLTGSNVIAGQVVVAGTGGVLSGSNNFWWDNSNGRVGIGTAVPTAKLTVAGDLYFDQARTIRANSVGEFLLTNPADAAQLTLNTGTSAGYITKINLYGGGSTPANTVSFTAASVEQMRVNSTGVGIGTTSYTARLFVSGTSTASTPTMIVREGVASPTGGVGVFDVQNSAGTSILFVTGSGRVGIGTVTPQAAFHVANGTSPNLANLYIGYAGSSNYYDANVHYFRDGSTNEKIRIDSSGNVGIGTISFADKLAVNGTMSVTGSLQPGTTLTYDLGSSTKYWRDVYARTGSFSGDVTVTGNLTVLGTQTIISSSQVNVGDNIILLNSVANPQQYGGIYVADTTANTTGSLIWDSNTNAWLSGLAGSEIALPTGTGTTSYVTRWTGTNTLGTGVLYDNNTNVGIGTASPSYKLHVVGASIGLISPVSTDAYFVAQPGTAGYAGGLLFNNAAGSSIGYLRSAGGSNSLLQFAGTTSTVTEVQIGSFSATANANITLYTNNVERIRIDSSGNVGVGTTTYTARLHISGSSSTTQPEVVIREGVPNPQGGVGIFDVQNSVGTSLLWVSGSGFVGIGTNTTNSTSAGGILHVSSSLVGNAASQLIIGSQLLGTSVNLYRGYTQVFQLANGTETMRITAAGNVTPGSDNTQDLGSTALRWRNVYAASISGSLTGSNVLAGQVVVGGTGGVLSGSNNFWWDDSTGRVGIGTASPTTKLYITGSASDGITIRTDTAPRVSYQRSSDGQGWSSGYDITNNGFVISQSPTSLTTTQRLFINSGGYVGIGTVTPLARFYITGSSTASDTTFLVREGVVSPTGGAATFDVQNSAGTSLFFVSGSGNVGIGTNVPTSKLHVVDTANLFPMIIRANGGTNILSLGSVAGGVAGVPAINGYAAGYAGVVDIALQPQGGNVGIGTNSTGDKLAVNGSMSVTGSALPGTDSTYNLGSSSKRWNTIYAANISGSLTGSNVLAGQVVVAGTGGVLSGSNSFWWDNTNGRVGIGTSNLTANLTIFGSSASTNIRIGEVFTNYVGINLNGSTSVNDYNILSRASDQTLYINRPSGNAIRFRESNSDQIVIASGGSVGIGTATAGSLLHLNAVVGSTIMRFSDSTNGTFGFLGPGSALFAGTSDTDFAIRAESSFFIRTNGSSGIERFRILSSGVSAFTGSVEPGTDNLYDLGSTSKRWRNIYAANISGSLTGSNVLAGQVVVAGTGGVLSGTNNFVWDNTNGRVGVGSTAPTVSLDVNGAVRGTSLRSNYHADSAGTTRLDVSSAANIFYTNVGSEVMRTDGSGNVGIGTNSWTGRMYVSGSSTGTATSLLVRHGIANGSNLPVFDVQNSAGTSLLFVSGSGNIGMGTATPATNLHVYPKVAGESTEIRLANDGTASGNPTFTLYRNTADYTTFVHQPGGNGLTVSTTHPSGAPIVFKTGATLAEVMRITGVGNVGIGTNNFTTRLYVSGSSTSSTPTMIVREGVVSPTGGVGVLDIQNSSGTSLLFVSGSGAVGIGTTVSQLPSHRLHVSGKIGGGLYTDSSLEFKTDGTTELKANSTLKLGYALSTVIDSSGQVGINTSTPAAKLDFGLTTGKDIITLYNNGANNQYGFGISANTLEMYTSTSGVMTFNKRSGASYTETLRIDSSGNVGIGTTLMSDKLAVNGSMSVTGSFLPGTDNTYDLGSSTKRWANVYATNVISSASLGPDYTTPTSTSGGTAIYDTVSITTSGAVYELMIIGNPNSNGDANYRDIVYGKIIIGTGYSGVAVRNYIQFVCESPPPRTLYSSGGGPLTADVVYLQSGVEYTDIAQGGTATIRIKVSGYNSAGGGIYVGNNTTVRLKKLA